MYTLLIVVCSRSGKNSSICEIVNFMVKNRLTRTNRLESRLFRKKILHKFVMIKDDTDCLTRRDLEVIFFSEKAKKRNR